MMAWEGYTPEAAGIKAALPHVDLYAPAPNAAEKPDGRSNPIWRRLRDGWSSADDRACRSDGSRRADEAAEQAFVLATVVRTVSVTAAKAGAKAIIAADGTSSRAGSAAAAPGRGAEGGREALADGEPRMVSVQPENLLAELGVKPGENRDGVRFASNMCPSKGTMDIFVEPVLPHPSLVILGASPVALSLAAQARLLGYHVTLAAPAADLTAVPDADT